MRVFILEKGKYYITIGDKDLIYIIAHMNNTEWTLKYRPIDYYETDESMLEYHNIRYGEDNIQVHYFT